MARATRDDLYALGLPEGALSNVPTADQDDALGAASDLVDTYLRSHHTLPLAAPYPPSIIRAESVLAAWDLITTRGHNPIGFDESLERRAEATIRWLEKLAAGSVSLGTDADATPDINEGAPRVRSQGANVTYSGRIEQNTTRGW
jgi:phage gp36-like protein